jgi:hypothetical protein
MRGQKVESLGCGADGAIILDILNLIGRFIKFGMETKQFPSPDWFYKGRSQEKTHLHRL